MKCLSIRVFVLLLCATTSLVGMKFSKIATLEELYLYLDMECSHAHSPQSVNQVSRVVREFFQRHNDQVVRTVSHKGKKLDLVDILHTLHARHEYHHPISGKTHEKYNILKLCARTFIIACIMVPHTAQLFEKLLIYVTVMQLVNVNTMISTINNKRYRLIQDLIYSKRLDLLDVVLVHKELLRLDLDVKTERVPGAIIMAVRAHDAQAVEKLLKAGVDPTKYTIMVSGEALALDDYVLNVRDQALDKQIKKYFSFYVPTIKYRFKNNRKIKELKGTIVQYFYENLNSMTILSELESYLHEFPDEMTKRARPTFFHTTKSLIDLANQSKYKMQVHELLLLLAAKYDKHKFFDEVKHSYELAQADSGQVQSAVEPYFTVRDNIGRSPAHLAVINKSDAFFKMEMPTIRGRGKDKYNLSPLDYALIYADSSQKYLASKKILWFLNSWLIKKLAHIEPDQADPKPFHPKELVSRSIALTNNINVTLGEYIRMRGLQRLFATSPLAVSWRYYMVQSFKPKLLNDFYAKIRLIDLMGSALFDAWNFYGYGDSDFHHRSKNLISALRQDTLDKKNKYVASPAYQVEVDRENKKFLDRMQKEKARKQQEKEQFIESFKSSSTEQEFLSHLNNLRGRDLLHLQDIVKFIFDLIRPADYDKPVIQALVVAFSRSQRDKKQFCQVLTKYSTIITPEKSRFLLGIIFDKFASYEIVLKVFEKFIDQNKLEDAKNLLNTIVALDAAVLPYEYIIKKKQRAGEFAQLQWIIDNAKIATFPIKKQPFLQTVPLHDFSGQMHYKRSSDQKKIESGIQVRYSFSTSDHDYFENVSLLHIAMLDGSGDFVENLSHSPLFTDLLKEVDHLGLTPLAAGLISALRAQDNAEMLKKRKEALKFLLYTPKRDYYLQDLFTRHIVHGYPIDIAAQIYDIEILKWVLEAMRDASGRWMQKISWDKNFNALHYAAINNFTEHCDYLVRATRRNDREGLYFGLCQQNLYWFDDSLKKYSSKPIPVRMTPRALALVYQKYDALEKLIALDAEDQQILEEGEIYKGSDIEFYSSSNKKLASMNIKQLAKRVLIGELKDTFLGNYIRFAEWIQFKKSQASGDDSFYDRFYADLLAEKSIKRKEKTFAAFLWRFPPKKVSIYSEIIEKAFKEKNQEILNVVLCFAAQNLPFKESAQVISKYLEKLKVESLAGVMNFENFSPGNAGYDDLVSKVKQDNLKALQNQQEKLAGVKFYDLNLLHYAVKGNNFNLVRYLVDIMDFKVDSELSVAADLLSESRPLDDDYRETIKPIDFAQTIQIREFLQARSEDFSLLARLKQYPQGLRIDYIDNYYQQFPDKLFTDTIDGQNMLEILVANKGTGDKIVWLIKKVIDADNKDYLTYMIPIVEDYLIANFPTKDIPFTLIPLPPGQTPVLEYAQFLKRDGLVAVMHEYIKNRKPRVFTRFSSSLNDLGPSLVSLKAKLSMLALSLDSAVRVAQ